MEKQQQIRIGIIEDYPALRECLKKIFESCNFEVVILADNGKHALESLNALDTLPDICVLDINMPVMDGFETAKILAQVYPQIKILVHSSLDNTKSITAMLRLGVRGYILKGVNSTAIKKAVLKVYHGGYYFSETVSERALNYLEGMADSADFINT